MICSGGNSENYRVMLKDIKKGYVEKEFSIFSNDPTIFRINYKYLLSVLVFSLLYVIYTKYYLFTYKYPMISREGYTLGMYVYSYLGLVLLNTFVLLKPILEMALSYEDRLVILRVIGVVFLFPLMYVFCIITSPWVLYQKGFRFKY